MSSMKVAIFVCIAVYSVAQIRAHVVLTNAQRMISLNVHNKFRSTVAMGNARNQNGTRLPKAVNMYKMSWSKMVERYAQTHANACEWKHTYVNGTSNNLYVMIGTSYVSAAKALNDSVYAWYNELANDGQTSLLMDGSNYNHFTQVVWAKTKEIGCAVNNCPKLTGIDYGANYVYTLVVCDYSPFGNYQNQLIYTPGTKSATKCPAKSVANTKTGLCQVKGLADIHV